MSALSEIQALCANPQPYRPRFRHTYRGNAAANKETSAINVVALYPDMTTAMASNTAMNAYVAVGTSVGDFELIQRTISGYISVASLHESVGGGGGEGMTESQVQTMIDTATENLASKTYVSESIANKMERVNVSELPSVGTADTNKVYVVPASDPVEGNLKTEYIVVDTNGTKTWELLGGSGVAQDVGAFTISAINQNP